VFRKRVPPTYICAICDEQLDPSSSGREIHWRTHVQQIPSGQGAASGQHTWACACGPSGMKWPNPDVAARVIGLHMEGRHSIPAMDRLSPSAVSLALRNIRGKGYQL
jgi:hypothetical protein